MLLPYAVPPIANGLIWSFIYNFKFGFLNRVLLTTGVISEPVNWAGNADTALIAVAIPYIWRTLPFAVLLVYAALQGINRDLYEAAAVDGASAWRRFWHITLPLLRPIIVVILILRTSFAFAVFEEVLAITQGGPGDATWVSAWYGYKVSFAPPFNIGMGAASAYVLALIVGLFAIAYVADLPEDDLMFRPTSSAGVAPLRQPRRHRLPAPRCGRRHRPMQSEKTLQADTRAILPPEYTSTIILTQGSRASVEQATYLPTTSRSSTAPPHSLIVSGRHPADPDPGIARRPTASPGCACRDGGCCRSTSPRGSCRSSC
jgi:ABC-type molybdate transport system permease subunit